MSRRTGWLSPKFDRELTGWRRIVTGRGYFPTTAAEGSDPSATTTTP